MRVVLLSLVNALMPSVRGIPEGADWVLHREGCRDIGRTRRWAGVEVDGTGPVEEVRERFNSDMSWVHGGYGDPDHYESWWRFDRDVHFAPCCRSDRRDDREVFAEESSRGLYEVPEGHWSVS